MFELYYRVVHSEYDDFVGQNGFFQIKCTIYRVFEYRSEGNIFHV